MNPYIKSNIDDFFKFFKAHKWLKVFGIYFWSFKDVEIFWGNFCWREIFQTSNNDASSNNSLAKRTKKNVFFDSIEIRLNQNNILFTRKQVFPITVVVGGIVMLEIIFIKNWSYKTFNELSLIQMYVATPCIFISLALILLFILNRSWYVNVIRLLNTFIAETYCWNIL